MNYDDFIKDMTLEQLDDLAKTINARRKFIADLKRLAFNIGDAVTFEHDRQQYEGVIKKINRVFVQVDVDGDTRYSHWNIHPNNLRVIVNSQFVSDDKPIDVEFVQIEGAK